MPFKAETVTIAGQPTAVVKIAPPHNNGGACFVGFGAQDERLLQLLMSSFVCQGFAAVAAPLVTEVKDLYRLIDEKIRGKPLVIVANGGAAPAALSVLGKAGGSLTAAVLINPVTTTLAKPEKPVFCVSPRQHPLAAEADGFLLWREAYHSATAGAFQLAGLVGQWAAGFQERHRPLHEEVAVADHWRSLLQTVHTGSHGYFADEPVKLGGTDLGASPYEFLLSALGVCTSMTLRLYANHKKMPLEHVEVGLKHHKVQAKDYPGSLSQDGVISVIERTLHLGGNLTSEERGRLLEIAGKCPVHRTLTSEIIIKTTIADQET